jgi:hypothetical protein
MRLADSGLPQTFLRLRHLSSDPPGATPSHKRAFRSLVMGNWNPEFAPVAAASLLALSILIGLEWRMGAAAEVEPGPGALTDFDLEAKGGPGGMGALKTPEEELPGWTDRDLIGCC